VGGLTQRGRRRARAVTGWTAAVALALSGLALPGAAEPPLLRYSGKVERVDLGEGLVVVNELAARGHRVRREVYVEMDTPIVTAARLRPWQMRGASAYEEVPVTLVDVVTGDFVVIESMEAGGRPVARRITIVERAVPPGRVQ
jgi:hypothetical protein